MALSLQHGLSINLVKQGLGVLILGWVTAQLGVKPGAKLGVRMGANMGAKRGANMGAEIEEQKSRSRN